ncbi:MAG TPA: acetate--CoA ligase family protein, partial [Acidimicrobiia bacterium]|nr:acetate--CoA ligase family protein [Acidimicrobiia bacterium]
ALSFLTCLDRPAEQIRSGPVGLVTQSGGTGSYLHNLAAERGSGLAISISTGNEGGVDVADALSALVEAEEVEVIALVLETVRRGDAFLQALKQAQEAGKPVVACLLGRSRQGSEMMVTHTGAMALPKRVLAGVLDAQAVTVTATPGELFEVSEVLARSRPPTGERAMVVTHSGGMAILLADLAAEREVELPPPSAELEGRLRPSLQLGSAGNPLDLGGIIGGPHRFAEVVETVGRSGEYDLLLAVSTAFPVAHTQTRVEGLLALDLDLPLVHLWMAGDQASEGLELLSAAGAPLAFEPRVAMAALAGLVRWSRPPEPLPAPMEVAPVEGVLSEHQSKLLLDEWGVPVVEGTLVTCEEEAVAAAARFGYPVVAKLAAPGLAHKARRGAVEVGLSDEASLRAAYRRLLAAGEGLALEGVRVERYRPGLEVIVGGVRHPGFGPMLLVGLGGAQAELVDTAVMAPAPLGPAAARRLLNRLGADSWPGPPDLDQLGEIVVVLGRLIAGPHVTEIEINPLAWTGTQWEALDALIRG